MEECSIHSVAGRKIPTFPKISMSSTLNSGNLLRYRAKEILQLRILRWADYPGLFSELITRLFWFVLGFLFFWSNNRWDLSSLTRYWTCAPAVKTWSLNHWTAREVSRVLLRGRQESHSQREADATLLLLKTEKGTMNQDTWVVFRS